MSTDTSVNTEFKELRKSKRYCIYMELRTNSYSSVYPALVKDVRATEKDLKGLKEAVEMVESTIELMPRASWAYS